MVESTYRDYLGKIGVSDMELDISLCLGDILNLQKDFNRENEE